MSANRTLHEQARDLPVLDEADVLVIGGGPGGIGASIAAARNGMRTILVDRFGTFGGTWTSGLVTSIMSFPFVRGVFEEISTRIAAHNSAWKNYGEGYGALANYDTEVAKYVLDQMVVEAGVRPYFFAQAASILMEGARIIGVVVESKQGRQVITGRQIIDASGDGDIAVMAGVAWQSGREEDGACQPMSLMFKVAGVDDERASAYVRQDPNMAKAWQAAKERGELSVPREDVLAGQLPRLGFWQVNGTRIIGKDATRLQDVTEAMIEGRRQVMEIANFFRKNIPGFEKSFVCETAPHVGVRESRRIRCDYEVSTEDIVNVRPFDDCIARGNWFIDIHNPAGSGTTRIHPPEGKWYEIPYRSIRAQGVDNLLVASRCLDCSHEAHAAIRITPQVVAIGQAAGTAAALCIQNGLSSTRALEAAVLRDTLRKQSCFV